MKNVAIFPVPVSLNTNSYTVKSSRNTNICRKLKFQGAWTKLKCEFCFLRQSITKYFETDSQNQIVRTFFEKLKSDFVQFSKARTKTFLIFKDPLSLRDLVRQLTHSLCDGNKVVPFHLRWRKTTRGYSCTFLFAPVCFNILCQ